MNNYTLDLEALWEAYCFDNVISTPCDYPDDDGEHRCPYADTYTGSESEMCRNCCGWMKGADKT